MEGEVNFYDIDLNPLGTRFLSSMKDFDYKIDTVSKRF